MNPYAACQQQAAQSLPRIDLLLMLYDRAIERLEAALTLPNAAEARAARTAAQLAVSGLASGVNVGEGDELPVNVLRLYEFTLERIRQGDKKSLREALDVLRTLREGFQEIRPEAVQLERSGTIPPADTVRSVQLTV